MGDYLIREGFILVLFHEFFFPAASIVFQLFPFSLCTLHYVTVIYLLLSLCLSGLLRQLNKIMAQLDLLKSLFDRAGGAKHGSTVVTSTKNRRSAETVSTGARAN